MPSIFDYNDYGGFESGGGVSAGTASGVRTADMPAVKSTGSGRNWYDGLADSFGSIVDTAVKVGVPVITAKYQADAQAKITKAQAQADAAARASDPRYATPTATASGLPKWAVYAGAAVLGVVALAVVANAVRRR